MKLTRLLVLAALCLAVSSICQAQDDDTIVGMGFTPFGSYHGGDLDSINLSNNFLNLHIPLVSLPQRGDISYSAQITYSPQQWTVVPNCSNENNCSPRWRKKAAGGLGIDAMGPQYFQASEGPYVSGSKVNVYSAVTQDGAVHQMGEITGRDGAI